MPYLLNVRLLRCEPNNPCMIMIGDFGFEGVFGGSCRVEARGTTEFWRTGDVDENRRWGGAHCFGIRRITARGNEYKSILNRWSESKIGAGNLFVESYVNGMGKLRETYISSVSCNWSITINALHTGHD